ncbi:hypothetical protein [Microbulbifer pacificus]|uniref:hypothetical protein n=1 Tax=Microbulbifer pacificus TaxID=407164 RepID=UPI000CF3E467|nr:hypothetical protein [Microbulbifer pacificus]
MSFKQEIYQDINDNCDILLNFLKDETRTNDTAAGRMIYQCRWLKEQVAANTLRFPVNDYLHTLKHVSAERLLEYLASSPDRYDEEIGIHFYRLLKAVKGNLLLKPTYYPYTIRCIEALLDLLQHPTRSLDQYERGLTDELLGIKQGLAACSIESPLMSYLPDYPNFEKFTVFMKVL